MNRDENIENDVAEFIAESVFNNLSANIRECIRIARLADNNIAKAQRVVDMLTTLSDRGGKLGIWYQLDIAFIIILKYYYIRSSEAVKSWGHIFTFPQLHDFEFLGVRTIWKTELGWSICTI